MTVEGDYIKYRKMCLAQNFMFFSKFVLFIVATGLSVLMVYNFDYDFNKNSMQEIVSSEEYINGPECGDLPFEDTAICLNDFARQNFFYNVTDDSLTLTIQEMMERGGDCKDWTTFYEVQMDHYGFNNSQRVRIFVEEKEEKSYYHVFLIASHSTGYCHMDIRDLQCYSYAKDDDEDEG